MMKFLFLFILIATSSSIKAQSIYAAESGEITFYSYAPLEDIQAKSTQINSFINATTGEIAFVIPMRSFHFPKSLMEEHFNEKYMETDKFPQATFKGMLNDSVDYKKTGIVQMTAKGALKIHGKEKQITEKGTLEINEGKIILTSQFFVALADFNITKPQIMFNNIADTIEVKMKATYVPYKKK